MTGQPPPAYSPPPGYAQQPGYAAQPGYAPPQPQVGGYYGAPPPTAPAPSTEDQAKAAEELAEKRARLLDIVAAILLGVVTVLSALAAHQGDMWGGQALETYHRGTVTMNKASSADLLGVQLLVIDGILYVEFLSEGRLGQEDKSPARADLVTYIHDRLMLDDFKLALAWASTKNGGATPFDFPGFEVGSPEQAALAAQVKALEGKPIPSYQDMRFKAGRDTRKEGEDLFEEGQKQDATGDSFMLTTLFYTVAMFFAGLAGTSPRLGIKVGFLGFATALTIFGALRMFALPFMF